MIIDAEDWVYYQTKNKKAWLGPVKVSNVRGNSIWVYANGDITKIPRCNVILY